MLRDYIELPLPVRILCLGSLINRAGSFVLIFLTIYASEEMGFGVGFAAACMGVFGLGSMCGSLLGGQLADQIGRRRVMLIALFGGAAMLLVVGHATNRWAFMASVWAFAVVADMYRPAASAMIADHVDVGRRCHAFALMYISINLGFALAPPIGGLLAEYSFRLLFIGDALTMALYGLIILAVIRESMPKVEEATESEGNSVESFGKTVFQICRDVPFMLWCLSTFFMALVFMQGMTTLPMHIRQLGFSNLEFGLLMSVNGLLIFLLQLPVTHWLSRTNPMNVVIAGGGLIAIGFGLYVFPGGFVFIALAVTVWTLGEILQAPFKHSIVTDMAPAKFRARYLGMFNLCYALAVTVGAPAGGAILSRYGPVTLWSAAFIVAIAAVTLDLIIRRSVMQRIVSETPESARRETLDEPKSVSVVVT